jgi:hypothetical protein
MIPGTSCPGYYQQVPTGQTIRPSKRLALSPIHPLAAPTQVGRLWYFNAKSSSRCVRGERSGQPWCIARCSEKQCRIGFQPVACPLGVVSEERRILRLTFMARKQACRPNTGWKPMLCYILSGASSND